MTEPLTADQLIDVVTAYRLSAAVVAMAELRIPDALAASPMTDVELAAHLGVQHQPLRALVRMLVANGVLIPDASGRLVNSGLSAALVDGAERDMLLGWRAMPELMSAWVALAPALRTGEVPFAVAHGSGFEDYLATHPATALAYATAMGTTTGGFDDVAAAADLSGCSTVVVVGGGLGHELVPILERWPGLRGVLVDLPAALDGAAEVLDGHGLLDRVTIHAGDARLDVPAGDAYMMSTVLRCMDDDDVVAVLSACERAGTDRVRTFVAEMPVPEGAPMHPWATNELVAWVAYGGGDRTIPEWTELHARAGLRVTGTVELSAPYGMIVAERR